jgi:hypothetical protein
MKTKHIKSWANGSMHAKSWSMISGHTRSWLVVDIASRAGPAGVLNPAAAARAASKTTFLLLLLSLCPTHTPKDVNTKSFHVIMILIQILS